MIVSGDQNEDGYKASMEDAPWVSIPFGADQASIEKIIPCTGYPTPGIVRRKDGKIIDADAFGKVNEGSLATWLEFA